MQKSASKEAPIPCGSETEPHPSSNQAVIDLLLPLPPKKQAKKPETVKKPDTVQKPDATKDILAEVLDKQKATEDKFDKICDVVQKLSDRLTSQDGEDTGNLFETFLCLLCLLL